MGYTYLYITNQLMRIFHSRFCTSLCGVWMNSTRKKYTHIFDHQHVYDSGETVVCASVAGSVHSL